MTPPETKSTLPEDDDLRGRLLRQLDLAPEAAQRATATALGISLGRLNALLRAATEAGFIKVSEIPPGVSISRSGISRYGLGGVSSETGT